MAEADLVVSLNTSPALPIDVHLERARRVISWILVLGFMFVVGMARGVYLANGMAPSERFELLSLWGLYFIAWFWFRQQCEPYGISFPLDIGWFLIQLWPILVPYYLWRGQRWRGLAKLAALLVAWLLANVVSVIVPSVLSWVA